MVGLVLTFKFHHLGSVYIVVYRGRGKYFIPKLHEVIRGNETNLLSRNYMDGWVGGWIYIYMLTAVVGYASL